MVCRAVAICSATDGGVEAEAEAAADMMKEVARLAEESSHDDSCPSPDA